LTEQAYHDRDTPGKTQKASETHATEAHAYANAENAVREEQAINDAAKGTDAR
jgi:hypothetical protein